MIHKFLFLPALLTAFLLAGCSKQTEDDIPAYIMIDSLTLISDNLQGTSSHKIDNVWVYSDEGLVGAYELPARVPVIRSGNVQFNLFAGIRMNGMAETRPAYPFFNPIKRTIKLAGDSITNLGTLQVTYGAWTQFAWIEDFESESSSLRKTARSAYDLKWYSDREHVFTYPGETGGHSAGITVDSDSTLFECSSFNAFKLPTDGHEVFLEINYRNNAPFTVGLFANGTAVEQHPILIVTPSEKWNKIYINLTPSVTNTTNIRDFRIYFSMSKPADLDKAELMLDNVKLLYSTKGN